MVGSIGAFPIAPLRPVSGQGQQESNAQNPANSPETQDAQSPQNTPPPNILTNENTNGQGLTPEEQQIVDDLKQRDAEVRAHEQAHKNVAGPYAGAISYEYTTGPDNRQYAIGGSVQIDVSPVPNNPRATIQKMETVIRAALAPAQPSSEDFAVARAAQSARDAARNELRKQEQAEAEQNGEAGAQDLIQQAIEAYTQTQERAETTTQRIDATSLFQTTA